MRFNIIMHAFCYALNPLWFRRYQFVTHVITYIASVCMSIDPWGGGPFKSLLWRLHFFFSNRPVVEFTIPYRLSSTQFFVSHFVIYSGDQFKEGLGAIWRPIQIDRYYKKSYFEENILKKVQRKNPQKIRIDL